MDVVEGPRYMYRKQWFEYRISVNKVLVPSILMSETRVELSQVSWFPSVMIPDWRRCTSVLICSLEQFHGLGWRELQT